MKEFKEQLTALNAQIDINNGEASIYVANHADKNILSMSGTKGGVVRAVVFAMQQNAEFASLIHLAVATCDYVELGDIPNQTANQLNK